MPAETADGEKDEKDMGKAQEKQRASFDYFCYIDF